MLHNKPNMNLKEFISTKKILRTKEELDAFFIKVDGELHPERHQQFALHVYQDSHYIDEYLEGQFSLNIENNSYSGTLQEMEQILFDWAEN